MYQEGGRKMKKEELIKKLKNNENIEFSTILKGSEKQIETRSRAEVIQINFSGVVNNGDNQGSCKNPQRKIGHTKAQRQV